MGLNFYILREEIEFSMFGRLEALFTFVLQHLHDCVFEDDPEELEEGCVTVQKCAPFLFDMAKFFPQSAAKSILSVVQEKYDDFVKNPKAYPTLETVSFCLSKYTSKGLLDIRTQTSTVNEYTL